MRRILIYIFLLMCIAGQSWAADITRVEYFYDNDPGIGNGTALEITSGVEATVTANISLAGLGEGMHYLYVRAMDSDGDWSISRVHPFYFSSMHSLASLPDIVAVEYFIDSISEEGSGAQVEITQGTEVEKLFNVNLNGLPPGLHYLYMRAKNSFGEWSVFRVSAFYVSDISLPNVTEVEYFIDSDPGYGAAKKISIVSGPHPSGDFAVDLTGVSVGDHQIEFRGLDDAGVWSTMYAAQFEIKQAYTITPSAGSNGAISPNTLQAVEAGLTKSFTVTPNSGYAIYSVGGTCEGTLNSNTYTTNAITANCTVTASFVVVDNDTDNDGIEDDWEIYWFGDIATANANSDSDKDGYSDLQEYLNNSAGESDPEGGIYDPTTPNATGGTGYRCKSCLPAIYMLLL